MNSAASRHQLRVGFIGLGVMGRPMAGNLLDAGFALTVHSRSRAKSREIGAKGGKEAESPAAAARDSDVLILMVPDAKDVDDLLERPSGLLDGAHDRLIVCDMGTHAPQAMRHFADRLAAKGAAFLDAPVSGGDVGARAATLAIMVGGPKSAFTRVLPVLKALGSRVVHVGPVGAGQIAKACNQLLVGSTIQAVAESLVLARAAGVDPAKVRDAMLGGFAASRVLEIHGQRMLESNFVPGARASLHAKDAHIVLATAEAVGLSLPGFQPVAAAFDRLVAKGDGSLDHSAVITLLEPRGRK